MSKDRDKKTAPPNKPAGHPLSGEERAKILETALYRMVMIDGMVYGPGGRFRAGGVRELRS